jgi:sugar lactone lactonase YvrE
MKAELALESRCELGEGPVWNEAEQALYLVDIMAPAALRLVPSSGELRRWPVSSEIGCLVLRNEGGAIIALRDGFHLLDFESGAVQPFANPPRDESRNRFNDGKCDPQGRLWAGTQDDLGAPQGALYRLDADASWTLVRDRVICSNGLGWSPDGRTFYYTDSFAYRIDAYDFDPVTGVVSNERVFAREGDRGAPDGLAVDEEGFVWSAKWDGRRVVRYAPDGTIDLEVSLPVQRPTSIAFAGPELDLLFVTSARWGLSDAQLAEDTLSGGLFVIEPGVRGVPVGRFGG